MKCIASFCIFASAALPCGAADAWYFLQRESGCLSFAEAPGKGYHWLAVPSAVKTPEQVLAHMRGSLMPDAQMTPLIDYAPARKPWQTDADMKNSPLTRGNAFVIHPRDNTKQVIVVTYELCRTAYGFARE